MAAPKRNDNLDEKRFESRLRILNNFISDIQKLSSRSINQGSREQAIKCIDCLRWIKVNEDFLRYAICNLDDDDIYTYKTWGNGRSSDKSRGNLRAHNDQAFHIIDEFINKPDAYIKYMLHMVSDLESGYQLAKSLNQLGILANKFNPSKVGCLGAKLGGVQRFIGELVSTATPSFEDLFLTLSPNLKQNTGGLDDANYDLAYEHFKSYLGKQLKYKGNDVVISKEFLDDYLLKNLHFEPSADKRKALATDLHVNLKAKFGRPFSVFTNKTFIANASQCVTSDFQMLESIFDDLANVTDSRINLKGIKQIICRAKYTASQFHDKLILAKSYLNGVEAKYKDLKTKLKCDFKNISYEEFLSFASIHSAEELNNAIQMLWRYDASYNMLGAQLEISDFWRILASNNGIDNAKRYNSGLECYLAKTAVLSNISPDEYARFSMNLSKQFILIAYQIVASYGDLSSSVKDNVTFSDIWNILWPERLRNANMKNLEGGVTQAEKYIGGLRFYEDAIRKYGLDTNRVPAKGFADFLYYLSDADYIKVYALMLDKLTTLNKSENVGKRLNINEFWGQVKKCTQNGTLDIQALEQNINALDLHQLSINKSGKKQDPLRKLLISYIGKSSTLKVVGMTTAFHTYLKLSKTATNAYSPDNFMIDYEADSTKANNIINSLKLFDYLAKRYKLTIVEPFTASNFVIMGGAKDADAGLNYYIFAFGRYDKLRPEFKVNFAPVDLLNMDLVILDNKLTQLESLQDKLVRTQPKVVKTQANAKFYKRLNFVFSLTLTFIGLGLLAIATSNPSMISDLALNAGMTESAVTNTFLLVGALMTAWFGAKVYSNIFSSNKKPGGNPPSGGGNSGQSNYLGVAPGNNPGQLQYAAGSRATANANNVDFYINNP